MKHWPVRKKILFIFAELALLLMILGFGVVVNAQTPQLIVPYQVENTATDVTNFYWNWPSNDYVGEQYSYRQTHESTDIDVSTDCTSSLQTGVTANADELRAINDFWFDFDSDCQYNGIFYLPIEFTSGSVAGDKFYIPYRYSHSIGAGVQSPDEITEYVEGQGGSISDINFNTKFTDVDVSGASTSVQFDVFYTLVTSEFQANNRPDSILVLITRNETFSSETVAQTQKLILPLINGAASTTIIVDDPDLIDGNYTAFLNFWNINTQSVTFSFTNIIVDFTIAGGVVSTFDIVEITDGQDINEGTTYQDCSFSNPQGCIVNAFIFAFVPSEGIFDKFSTVYQDIETKPPFGYYGQMTDALVLSTTTAAFSFGTLPFQDEIFTPLKNLLGIAMILIYALFFTHRIFHSVRL